MDLESFQTEYIIEVLHPESQQNPAIEDEEDQISPVDNEEIEEVVDAEEDEDEASEDSRRRLQD